MATNLSEIDQTLIRYGDTESAEALSFRIKGLLSPAQCAARLTILLDTPDWLTAAQQDQLVTQKMRMLVVKLEEMMVDTPNARIAEVLGAQLERIGTRLDKRSEATEKDLTTLYAFQGSVLLEAVTISLNHMKTALTGGDEIAEAAWDAALESAIRLAQIELSRHEELDA